ncbi:MAG: thermonuclease family protein, partial [Atopobiaceae bacterium]|nr:thermonuclease family protein [Atopobiaceae bacterium]
MRAKSSISNALAASLAFILACTLLGCSGVGQERSSAAPEAEPIPVAELEPAEVVRIIDGDTRIVRMSDGSEERVRLIGIDAPESKSPDEEENCPEGEQAEANLRETLPKGERVWLSKDTSERDRYGRLLRYIWLEK